MRFGLMRQAPSTAAVPLAVYRTEGTFERMRGLLGRRPLRTGEGLWLTRCASVHTVGMRYALDLLYLDRHRVVVKMVRALPPGRFSLAFGADSVIELPAGSLQMLGLQCGDRCEWREIADAAREAF
jgi:uncharacterized membrane protein (UPF0127 family)